MPQNELRFRQVHLDFHTSPDIPDVGAEFDPEQFAQTLERAHVDSVTCFARCHHGHLYYQSKVHPERIHPHLQRPNLLPEQIEAAHRRGIRVPIYTTVQWDQFTSQRHPDWALIHADGRLRGTPPLKPGFYRSLDVLNPGYRQFLKDHTKELFELMPVDGLFFDIVQPNPSVAPHWLDAMDDAGYDPENSNSRKRFAQWVIDQWKLEMSQFIRSLDGYHDQCTIFYNGGNIGPRHRGSRDAYSHYEIESLPSGGWGYMDFPRTARIARTLSPDHDYLGMTGKFHSAWGDFHSFKNPAALEFETFHMLALGAKCSIGDQLPPNGRLDQPTYELIGSVYQSVEAKEPWCRDVQPLTEIGLFTPEEFANRPGSFAAVEERESGADSAAVRMLQELQCQFDLLSSTAEQLERYPLLILPDSIPVDPEFAAKLDRYVSEGGTLIASHRSGLNDQADRFALQCLGVDYLGQAPYRADFLVPGKELAEAGGLGQVPYVMYQQGVQVKPRKDAQTLAEVQTPYFNRTWRHFCSHRHAPSSGQVGYPGVIANTHGQGRCIYFMHPLFSQYQANAPRWCRQLLDGAINLLLDKRLVRVDGPSTVLATLNRQPEEHNRLVLHLLHYIPERRGQAFDTIEDVIPLHDLGVSLHLDESIGSVRQVPGDKPLDYTQEAGQVHFTVPRVEGHTMIELNPA